MSDSPTSDIGMMYRQLLQSRGVPLTGENMQRVVAESRRTPGLIPGLAVQGEDTPNEAAAGMPTQPGVPNSGVAPPLAPRPTAPLPVPPAPPSYGELPTVDNVHPGATSPGGVIPGTAATPSSPISAPLSMSLPGSMPSAPMPSPASGGMDSSDIAQLVLGLLAGGGAGLAPLLGGSRKSSSGGGEYMGNAGPAPFNMSPDRQAPTVRQTSEPVNSSEPSISRSSSSKSPSGAPDRGPSVGQSGNSSSDIERTGGIPNSPITTHIDDSGQLRLQEGGSGRGAMTRSNTIQMRDDSSGPTIRGQNQSSGPTIATEAPSLDRQAQLTQQMRRVGRTPSVRGIRIP